MRKFNISVNGNSYEVEVEEIGRRSCYRFKSLPLLLQSRQQLQKQLRRLQQPQPLFRAQRLLQRRCPGSIVSVKV